MRAVQTWGARAWRLRAVKGKGVVALASLFGRVVARAAPPAAMSRRALQPRGSGSGRLPVGFSDDEDSDDDSRARSPQASLFSQDGDGYESSAAGGGGGGGPFHNPNYSGGGGGGAPPPQSLDDLLAQKLSNVPGFSTDLQGASINPRPPRFAVDAESPHGDWTLLHTEGVTDPARQSWEAGKGPRFVRYEQVVVLKKYLQTDAETIGDWDTLTDPDDHRSQVAVAKVLGMLTIGTSQGVRTGSPSELEGKTKEELAKAVKLLEEYGIQREYTFCPDKTKAHETAPQFTWFFEWLYDPDGKTRVAFRITKAISDRTHSSDELWQDIMDENAKISKSGQTNGMTESRRSTKFLNANKLIRQQIDASNLENCAEMMCKTVRSGLDVAQVYSDYGGRRGSNLGYPLYPDMRLDLPKGCQMQQLKPHKVWGGSNPLGPSIALRERVSAQGPLGCHRWQGLVVGSRLGARTQPRRR